MPLDYAIDQLRAMAQVILTLVLYAVRVIAAPAWQPLSTASHIEGNNTLQPGLVPDHEPTVKRTVYWMCAFDDPESFSVTLDGAFEDAYTMVSHSQGKATKKLRYSALLPRLLSLAYKPSCR